MKEIIGNLGTKPFHFVLLILAVCLVYIGDKSNPRDAFEWVGVIFAIVSIFIYCYEAYKEVGRTEIERLLNRPASQLLDESVQVPIYIIDSSFDKIMYMNSRAREFYGIPEDMDVTTLGVKDLLESTKHLYNKDMVSYENDRVATLGFIESMRRDRPRSKKIPPKFFIKTIDGEERAFITQISSFAIESAKPKYLVEISEISASAIANKGALIEFLKRPSTTPPSGISPLPDAPI